MSYGNSTPEARGQVFWRLAFCFVFVVGLWLRLDGIFRGLEYDEIWTLTNYAGKDVQIIFSDLSTPNNHPLHSFFVKLSCSAFGFSFLSLRFPALLFGLLISPMAALFAWRLMKDRMAAFLVFALCSFSGALIHYSQAARGYSLQTFSVLLAAYALYSMESRRERYFSPVVFLLASVASILAVPSGIVFIAPLCLFWLVFNIDFRGWRDSVLENLPMLFSFVVFGVVAMFWYGLNYSRFKAGQSFGESVTSVSSFLAFSLSRLRDLLGWGWLLLPIPLFFKGTRRVGLICAGIVGLALISAVFVKMGPSRVYLPFVPFAFIGLAAAIMGIESATKSNYRYVKHGLCCLFVIYTGFSAQGEKLRWTPLDWIDVIPAVTKSLPQDVFIDYPSGDAYCIRFNCGNSVVQDNIDRISSFGNGFVQLACCGKVSGMELKSMGQVDIPVLGAIPAKSVAGQNGLLVETYSLRRLSAADTVEGRTVLAVADADESHSKLFKDGGWLLLNSWLGSGGVDGNGRLSGNVFAINSPKLSSKALFDLSFMSGGKICFFLLESPK